MEHWKNFLATEAVRFIGWDKIGVSHEHAVDEYPTWLKNAFENKTVVFKPEKNRVYINTHEGKTEVTVGDYIIKDTEGNIYSCKPDILKNMEKPIQKGDDFLWIKKQ